MIGGQGEKKTLRLMAQHAEMANFTSGFDELPHKLDVLRKHCAEVGRDHGTINKTPLCSVVVGETMEEAVAIRNAFLLARGLDFDVLDDATKAMVSARIVMGDADAVGEQVRGLIAMGMDGITANTPGQRSRPRGGRPHRRRAPGRRRLRSGSSLAARAEDAELVALGVGEGRPRTLALPDVDVRGT